VTEVVSRSESGIQIEIVMLVEMALAYRGGEAIRAPCCKGLDDVTAIEAELDLLESWVDVAVTVAVPVAAGVKTPELLTLPMLDGLTDQFTDWL